MVSVLRCVFARSQRRSSDLSEGRLRTLGYYALALQQVQGIGTPESGLRGVLSLIARSGLVFRVVILLLFLFSIASWGIIFFKLWQFRRVAAQTNRFLDVFRQSSKFSEVQSVCRSLAHSPLVGVFLAGYVELNDQLRQNGPPEGRPGSAALRPNLRSFDALDRAILRASTVEVNKLERHVPFLATTAAITPFIGLFGTVWGIMGAFQGIGETGSTSLGVVAPGIAEALIATAFGLAAAIPAVYFYNHLTQRVKQFASSMEEFSLEFLNIAERNFT